MEQIKTFMGDVVESTSPSIMSEQEAIDNASFGKYTYDPMSRMVSLPGWQGYSTSPNPNGFYGQPQQQGYIGQAMGIGMNPYVNQMYQQPIYGYIPVYNPFAPRQPQQQPQQPTCIQIPPLNYRGQYLPETGFEDKLGKLAYEAWVKEQEQAVTDQSRLSGYGYNYYGNMMYNFYNPQRMEAQAYINQVLEEAKENRLNFNLNLGKLAFNITYGKGNYNEEELERIYKGRVIENNAAIDFNQQRIQERFSNLIPFDNSQYYQRFHQQITDQHNAIIRPDSNMQEAFESAGELWAIYQLEEEQHRRRNLSGNYNLDGYKYIVRRSLAERNKRNGIYSNPVNVGGSIPAPGMMNIYTKNPRNEGSHVTATPSIDSQGNMNMTLSIPCNIGSQKGTTYTVVNANEAAYDQKREEFNRFVDSIPRSIYNGGG